MSDWNNNIWQFSDIGKELNLINGFGFKPFHWKETGIPIIRIQNLNDEDASFDYIQHSVENRYFVNNGDLLFAWSGSRGTSFGPFIWKKGLAVLNQHIFNVKLKNKDSSKRFAYWWLKYLVGEIEQQAHGSAGLVHITRKQLEKFRFPIIEIRIQRKIAKILTTVDNLIEKTEALIAKYQSIKQGMMHDLFTRGVDSNGKLRPQQSEVMSDWETVRIDQVGKIVTGSTPSPAIVQYWDGEVPFITPTDINESVYVCNTERRLTKLGTSFSRLIPANSVMVVCIGSTIGKTACPLVESVTNQQINTVIPCDLTNPRFLYYTLLRLADSIKQIAGVTAIPIINKTAFSLIEFKLPPLPQQRKIAEILSKQDQLIEDHEKELMKYKQLKTALMQDLLTGKVQVTPDEIDKELAHA
jgi:type I restriction enzyme, S subunit